MRHRFLVHELSHTLPAVDVTSIGLPTKIYPETGEHQVAPTIRFNGWKGARDYFLRLGAEEEVLDGMYAQVRKTGIAVLTIP